MSSCSEHSENSIPVICQDETNDLQKVKEAANKALKNIQSLYNEIMTPKSFTDLELEDEYNSDLLTSSTPGTSIHENYPEPCQNTKFKRSDLCNSCRKYLSYCSTCHNRHKNKDLNHQGLVVRNNLLEPNNTYINESIHKFNITIPQPFSLTQENVKRQEAKAIKIAKLKEELEKEIEKELNVKVRSQPVPKHVSLPLYEEMAKRSENRKKERRGKCREMLEKETKPFNLSASAKTGKSKSVCDITKETGQFRAKPVPKNILSENVSQRIKDKEKLRKILMTHRAEEMLRQSSLPFSPKPIPRSFSMSNLGSKKDVNKLPKPNIDAITKRLYTIKCKETMESWNNKVLEQNTHSDKNYSKQNTFKVTNDSMKSKLFPDYALPYYNFPVRMSTAAMLRDKQIREELSSRKRKEEQNEMIKEEMARRKKDFLKNIWPRLKSVEPTMNSNKEIEEKVKSFKISQKNREEEYEKEIEEMMKRVSKQYLLIERQSKEKKEMEEIVTKSVEEDSEKESSNEEEASEKHSSNTEEGSEINSSNKEEGSEKNSSNKEEGSEKNLSNKEALEKTLSNQSETEGSEEFELSSATSEKSE